VALAGMVGWLGKVVMVPRHRRRGRLYRLCSFLGSAIKLSGPLMRQQEGLFEHGHVA
jgi:hypothetical protein